MSKKPKKQPRPDKILQSFFNDIDLVKDSPRFQIIVTNGYLELLVNALVEDKCKNTRSLTLNYGNKLILLNELKLISDAHFIYLDAFRDLRNKAAHVAQFTLKQEMIAPYKNLLIGHMLGQFYRLESFRLICHTLLGGFWNYHVKFFHPYFNPELVAREAAEAAKQKLIIDSLREPLH